MLLRDRCRASKRDPLEPTVDSVIRDTREHDVKHVSDRVISENNLSVVWYDRPGEGRLD